MDRLPGLNTGHLLTMTDDTGMLQHAIFSVPNSREGYTTDDNARALIVSTQLENAAANPGTSISRGGTLPFSGSHSMPMRGGSGTSSATTATGWNRLARKTAMAALCGPWELSWDILTDAGLRGAAGRLFESAVPSAMKFTSPRAWAFSVLGMQAYLGRFPGDRVIQDHRNTLADRLLDIYQRSSNETWHWFEKTLSYSNARLPQALILAGWHSENKRMFAAGIESLRMACCGAAPRRRRGCLCPSVPADSFSEGKEKTSFRSATGRSLRHNLCLS